MRSIRISASEELLPFVDRGFRVLGQTTDMESVSVAFSAAIDEELKASTRDPEDRGSIHVEVVSRTFVEAEMKWLSAMLRLIDEAFARRRTSSCELDLLLLMQDLFEEGRGKKGARDATGANLKTLEGEWSSLDSIGAVRVWLLDGQANDGSSYSIQDVAGVLCHFDPCVASGERHLQDQNCLSFGIRTISFPRAKILNYLGTRFALDVLSREKWIDAAAVQAATVAGRCAAFLDNDLAPILADMELDEEGKPIVPTIVPPPFSRDEPVEISIDRVHEAVDNLVRTEFPRVQAQLVGNRAKTVARLSDALARHINYCIDDEQGRVTVAQGFLEVLQDTDNRPHVVGDLVETGRPRTLRQAFTPALEFFDKGAHFDSAKRSALAVLREEQAAEREWLSTMESELQTARRKHDEGEVAAGAEAEALEGEIKSLTAKMTETQHGLEDVAREVKTQDWEIQTNRKGILNRMLEEVDEGIVEAQGAVEKSASMVSEAQEAVRRAQSLLRDAIRAMTLRVIGLVLGLALIGLVGILLVPLAFGLAPVVGPSLFGFIGTAFGVAFAHYWAIVALLSIVGYAGAQAVRYFRLRRKVADAQRTLDLRKDGLQHSLREYWAEYSRKFTTRCDWTRHSHVYDTDRSLETFVDEQSAGLEEFRSELRSLRERAKTTVDGFKLSDTSTELAVVDQAYVADVVTRQSDIVDLRARTFFQQPEHAMSTYSDQWCRDKSGIEKLDGAMQAFCANEAYADVREMSVTAAIKATGFSLAAAVRSIPVFLPIDPAAGAESFVIVLGPDDGFLHKEMDKAMITPNPVVLRSDDEERLIAFRVGWGIQLADVTVLGSK